ncbi:hypothetical protein, partial [Halorubrum ezzemoulense]|uniref:hypothetical protein n=1 Tax=Halorubrum ezzemoulense TaxID=337243 RepID=UPI00280D6901|nr:hypothetical protein [Halorubrum ezzemoulense]
MERPSPRLIFFAVLLVLSSSVIVASVASASSSYDVSVANSIDVPDRTEEIEVNYRGLPVRVEFDITSVGRVEPGEDIDVDTIGPENESYDVIKASGDEEITSVSLTGDNSTTFSTDGDDPGTYLVAVQVGNTELSEKAVPVVVAAYDAELTIPDEAAPGETVNATIELEPYDEEPAIDSVELVLMDGDDPDRIEANATNPSEDIYEAEVTVPESEGDYTVFSTVFGEESLSESEQEMLEITKTSIEVTEDAADDDSDDNNNNVSDPDDGNETNTSDPDDGTETNVTDPDDGNETNVTDPDDGNETNVTDPDDGNETNVTD